jgi:hypothetical protein
MMHQKLNIIFALSVLVFLNTHTGVAQDTLISATSRVIYRVNVSTGKFSIITSGGLLDDIDDIGVGPDGFIYAGNGSPPRTVRVDPTTGQQTLLSSEAIGWNLAIEKLETSSQLLDPIFFG